MSNQPRVIILGCGFGGLGASHSLRKAPANITLLDRNDYHTFQPLLYQVATATLEPETVGQSIREMIDEHPNYRFHQTAVSGINLEEKLVHAEEMEPVPYDYLVVALGAQVNFFGVPGAAEHTLPLYTLRDAKRLKDHVLRLFEKADKQPSLVEHGALNIVVVGGGPTGEETAGALAELFSMDFARDYPDLPVSKGKVILVDGGPALLRAFKEELQVYVKECLEKRGVEIRLGEHVTSIGPESVTLQSGIEIKAKTVVWAGGLQANPIGKLMGIDLGHGGRVPVQADLSLEGYPEVFVVGDIAEARDAETSNVLPQLGSVALQAGRHAGKNIASRLKGEDTSPFQYHDKGIMATIGRGAAIAQLPMGITLRGKMGWLAWSTVHLALLTGWESRMSAMVDWAWDLFRHEHGKRLDIDD